MNNRNSISKKEKKFAQNKFTADENINTTDFILQNNSCCKTRKKREELSVSATKSIKKEDIDVVLRFE